MIPFGPAAPCGSGGSKVKSLDMPSHDSLIVASGPGPFWARAVGQTENAPPTTSTMAPNDGHLHKLAAEAFDLRCMRIGKSFDCCCANIRPAAATAGW